ncbi:Enzymatic polyprotein [Vitis vinifera]|uniref:Enzymatic polyprotein n=1 Tax=Vitis vinifera TaxID=29760 RepID=A0A438CNB7_VITVI|nr:Enzymatic polyprotein [Vitis vinifera]
MNLDHSVASLVSAKKKLNESTQESQQDESPVMSPTYSQMINTISLSDEDFEINKDLLRKDFYSEVNKQRNDWFFSTIPKCSFELSTRSLVPTQFYEKTRQTLFGANGKKLIIKYKLSNAHICNQGICIKQTFILVKDLKEKVLLGVPFLSLHLSYVIKAKQNHINLLKQEIALVRIEDQLKVKKTQDAIESLKNKIIKEVALTFLMLLAQKQHEVELPYEPDFSEKNIPTKARPIQMNKDLLSYCEKEIQDLMDKKLIRKSNSPWSCSAFYVQKQAELERGTPRLVINYKPLNDVFKMDQIAEKIDSVEQHWKHLNRSIEFADKFPDEIKDKKQLQRFLGSLNYVSDFIQDLSQLCAPLRQRLKKNSVPWNEDHTKIVKIVKSRVKTLPCLALADHKAFKIVETDASDIGFTRPWPPRKTNNLLGSSSHFNHHIPSTSPSRDIDSSSESLPFGRYEILERKLELVDFHKLMLKAQASFSPLENGENKHSTPLVNDKLSEEELGYRMLRMYHRPGLSLVTDKEVDDSKICRMIEEPFQYQQGIKKMICNCNRNFTISRVCLDLQYYSPISIKFKFGRKIALGLTQGFKMNKKFADAIIISKAPEWVSSGKLIPAQHIVSLHYQNRRPTRLSYPLLFSDICVEPIIKQIKHWRARTICRDFEAFPGNMGHLIAADSCHQIFCGKKLDPLPALTITEDIKLLDEHPESNIPGQKSIVTVPSYCYCYYSSTIQARVYYS